jgi:hypothetical protein
MARPLVRAVFGALILATFAAFFVAQQLKSEFPLVLRFAAVPGDFSPNGDGFRDFTFVGFDLSEPAEVKFSLIDANGNEVRTFVDGKRLAGDRKYRFIWHGRDNDGRRVPDGSYRMRLIRTDEGRVINSLKDVVVDTKPPRVRLVSARPGVIVPGVRGAQGPVRISYRGPKNESPEMRIFRTDGGPVRVVARFRGDDHRGATWYGTTRGKPAADGDYAFTVTVRDKAGNPAVAPREIPTRAAAPAGTGVSVRRLTLSGPLGVVPAGSLARLRVGPARRRLRFAVYRLGARRPLRTGDRTGGPVRVRIPAAARTGVYLVSVRAAGHRAVWPLAVQGRSRPARRRPLVVLPAIGWQGANPVDDDLDGFADTLADARSVRLARPFAGGRLPAGFRGRIEPMLRFLDRRRLAYDITTDLALARGPGPALARAAGVVFPGSERWLPRRLQDALTAYVRGGGRVATFGDDAFKRTVRLGAASLRDPSPPAARNAFGETTSVERAAAAPLLVEEDRLGLFGGDGLAGEFTLFERSRGLGPDQRLLTSAGREAGERDLVAYRLGKGTVFRSGTPQWAGRLGADPAVADATIRLWRLLSRG